jgi:hypothetical protein
MLQFYFLSIVLNTLAGIILVSSNETQESLGGFFLKNETTKFVIGILSALTGLMKILSVIQGDIPIIGDLVPAIAGLLCGFILIYEYYRNRTSLADSEQTEKINRIFVANKKIIGAAAIAAAVLHFLFPHVLLL